MSEWCTKTHLILDTELQEKKKKKRRGQGIRSEANNSEIGIALGQKTTTPIFLVLLYYVLCALLALWHDRKQGGLFVLFVVLSGRVFSTIKSSNALHADAFMNSMY
jgi:hypothetical protein